jgi:hypothetical protein
MSGKSRALAVAAAAAGLIALWAPAALASTPAAVSAITPTAAVATTSHAPLGANGWLVDGGLVNGGLVNVNLGSGNTAINDTCKNTSKGVPESNNVIAWALDVSHNSCVMAGGPNHF